MERSSCVRSVWVRGLGCFADRAEAHASGAVVFVPLQALLLQTLQAFKQLLADMPPDSEGPADGEAGPSAESAWRTFALYSLRSFLRKYFLQLAPLAGQLEGDMFTEGAVAADVRAAALPSLRM